MLLANVVSYWLSDFGPMDAKERRIYFRDTFCIGTVIEMSTVAKPDVWLIRHGETEWTVSRRHTGLTNLPLTDAGENQARALRKRLQTISFVQVFNSPLQRAARTCELAGYGLVSRVDQDLVEWNYGDYEGN